MDETTTTAAADTIAQLERVRSRVRADRRPASVPLEVLAAGTALFAVGVWILTAFRDGGVLPLGSLYWGLAAPIGFAVIAARYRRIEAAIGVGTQRRIFRVLAVAAVVSLVLFPVLMLPLAIPYAILGAVYAVLGARWGSAWLVAGGIAFGVLGSLESFLVLSNRVLDVVGYVTWAVPLAWTVVALVLIAIAVGARRSERSS